MKKFLINIVLLAFVVFVIIFIISSCNRITGDNKITKIDSSPKPELISMSIRDDVPPIFTNKFNGEIKFVEKNLFDTTTYDVYVGNNKVRIDKILNNVNKESYLFDLKTKEMIALNHQHKLYSIISIHNEELNLDISNFKIIKSDNNEKTILGIRCKQWRVRNTKENTEITYWVSSNNFGFYYYLIKLWNSSSKINRYFSIIPNSFGYMPLEIAERNLFRDLKTTILVTHLLITNIDSTKFIIPNSYTLFTNY